MTMMEARFDKVSFLGIVFMAGYITCAAVNHTAVLPWLWGQRAELVQVKTKVIPKLASAAGCEHKRADTNGAVAKQAILSANAQDAQAPDQESVVEDNCLQPSSVLLVQRPVQKK